MGDDEIHLQGEFRWLCKFGSAMPARYPFRTHALDHRIFDEFHAKLNELL
jgi:hypothetical protein